MNKDKSAVAICHGSQIIVSADVVRGRRATSYSSVRKSLHQQESKLWIKKW